MAFKELTNPEITNSDFEPFIGWLGTFTYRSKIKRGNVSILYRDS